MKQRILQYARSLVTVVKQLRLKGIITAITSQSEFSQLIGPLGERPLILTAHPGNEVMAMGGTMAAYAKKKIPMTVLTFTAGRRGTNTGRLSKSLGPKRKKEQLAGFKVVGGDIKLTNWDMDEKFIVDDQLAFSLLEVVDDLHPDIIYTPSLFDSHLDNQAINQTLFSVLQRLPSPRLKTLRIAQYELWTPIVPNKILSINDFEEIKQKAIECHESQLLCRNYLDAMMGLNRYRAAILGAGTCAEAFFICSPEQYVNFGTTESAPVLEQIS